LNRSLPARGAANLAVLLADQPEHFLDLGLGALRVATKNKPAGRELKPVALVASSQSCAQAWQDRFALQHKVIAGVQAQLPGALVWQLVQALVQAKGRSPLAPDSTVWWIVRYPPLVALQPNELARLRLAWSLASTLDQVLTYRPDWITQWLSDKPQASITAQYKAWQQAMPLDPVLLLRWLQKNTNVLGDQHPFDLAQQMIAEALLDPVKKQALAEALPYTSVLVLGWPLVPQRVLQMFAWISCLIPVSVIALNPSQAYWQELRIKPGQTPPPDETWLLGAWGQQQQRAFTQWLQLSDAIGIDLVSAQASDPVDSNPLTALDWLQQSIAAAQPANTDRVSFVSSTVCLACAPGAWREVEVALHWLDQCFEQDASLQAHEVAIFCAQPAASLPALMAIARAQHWPLALVGMPNQTGSLDISKWLACWLVALSGLQTVDQLARVLDDEHNLQALGVLASHAESIRQVVGELVGLDLKQARWSTGCRCTPTA
jgi:exonuclease V gamma subunit